MCVRVFRVHTCCISLQGHVYCSAPLRSPQFLLERSRGYALRFQGLKHTEKWNITVCPGARGRSSPRGGNVPGEDLLCSLSLAGVFEASECRNPAQDGPCGAPIQPWVLREGVEPSGQALPWLPCGVGTCLLGAASLLRPERKADGDHSSG